MRFYLAGGMRGRPWQKEVKEHLGGFGHTFIDPCEHGLKNPRDYTLWDLGGVTVADGVIAYMEETNPSGIGLTLELGIAIGQGKPTYFANESLEPRWNLVNTAVSKHFVKLEELLLWVGYNVRDDLLP